MLSAHFSECPNSLHFIEKLSTGIVDMKQNEKNQRIEKKLKKETSRETRIVQVSCRMLMFLFSSTLSYPFLEQEK